MAIFVAGEVTMWYKDRYAMRDIEDKVVSGADYNTYDVYEDDEIPEDVSIVHDKTKIRPSVKKKSPFKKPPRDYYDKEFMSSKEKDKGLSAKRGPRTDFMFDDAEAFAGVIPDYGRIYHATRSAPIRFRSGRGEILELSYLLKSGAPIDVIDSWIHKNASKYPIACIKDTFKKANREDLVDFFISEGDIDIGDTVKSRFTSRVGEVVGIHWDGDTIEVKWDSGGVQLLSKESVYKLNHGNPSELVKVKSVYDNYGPILPKRLSKE